MSNVHLVIEERATHIGNFLVGRLLPFRQKRMVGPFIFIDHMGPVKMNERENFDVLPHPHIGLSTLTFLFEGSIMHRDTLGNEIEIQPGAVNWMTAGKGIVHSERTPERLRHSDKDLHGLQIWVALPKELENMPPEFCHVEADSLPSWEENGLHFKLIAGELFGHRSPVPVYSKLFMLEITCSERKEVNIGAELFGEACLYILQGSIETGGETYLPKQLLVAQEATLCSFTMEAGSTLYLFGGDAFAEERFIDWNFVSSNPDTIREAKAKWLAQDFEKIKGEETDFVPYPIHKK
ncbi:MAG: hypothetical protein JWQ27_2125 [Ferruginibacter sp.]|nr:hypothetical protein [Ferruginibacter sp.]